eukprot:tig00000718_g3726.t1
MPAAHPAGAPTVTAGAQPAPRSSTPTLSVIPPLKLKEHAHKTELAEPALISLPTGTSDREEPTSPAPSHRHPSVLPSSASRLFIDSYMPYSNLKSAKEPEKFRNALLTAFPEAVPQRHFIFYTHDFLFHLGFNRRNTIPAIGLCRDEICRSLYTDLQEYWSPPGSVSGAFNMCSLGGMPFLGKTGLLSAQEHAPQFDGVERHLYIAMPHVAIGADGCIGQCVRHGRSNVSHACGALLTLQRELSSGRIDVVLDPDDVEQSMLKQLLLPRIKYGSVPSLVELSKHALDVITETLEKNIKATLKNKDVDWALITGIQIHGPDIWDYISPGTMYAMVRGERHEISLPSGSLLMHGTGGNSPPPHPAAANGASTAAS